jgi:uncharacterized protein (TIGR02246 family)
MKRLGNGFPDRLTNEVAIMTANQKAITSVLTRYAAALKAADAAAVAALYTDDGVLMAPEAPSVVGKPAVEKAYAGMFQAIGVDIQFHVAEIVELTPEWAFARTTSSGTIAIKAAGATIPEANQELFIFHKGGDGMWKIARYSFSVTNPPQKQ